jgi:hypothetical protein
VHALSCNYLRVCYDCHLQLHSLRASRSFRYLLQSIDDLLSRPELRIYPVQYDTNAGNPGLSSLLVGVLCHHDGGRSHRTVVFIQKITDKLKNKIVDLIILAYIIDLKFDFEMYMLVVFVIFSFILHNHLIFRSEYVILSRFSWCMSTAPRHLSISIIERLDCTLFCSS